MISIGSHRSPHTSATTLLTKTFLDLHLDWIGSTTTVVVTPLPSLYWVATLNPTTKFLALEDRTKATTTLTW